MLTRLFVNRLLVNIVYMKMWVHLRKKLGTPVQPGGKVSLEPCRIECMMDSMHTGGQAMIWDMLIIFSHTI